MIQVRTKIMNTFKCALVITAQHPNEYDYLNSRVAEMHRDILNSIRRRSWKY